MLYPKLLLQEAWQLKITWDEELPCSIAKHFNKWLEKLPVLQAVEIPRCLISHWCSNTLDNMSLHVFCDASKHAYASCVFLRCIQENGDVYVQLVQARAKVVPLKKISIPRLELLACTIGSRLADTVRRDLKMQDLRTVYWTDSTDALYWIKSDDQWGTFVWNRVKEIRSLSNPTSWRHVSGNQNPADLPSRGCSAPHLVSTKWWEGPPWLKKSEEEWPKLDVIPSQDTIDVERKKTTVSAIDCTVQLPWYCKRFSSFWKIIRQLHWRNENKTKTEPLSVGDVVLVGDNGKRLDWALGKITEIFPGKDGYVRLAKVQTKSGTFLRPAQKLYPMEVRSADGVQLRTECKKRKNGNEECLMPNKETVFPQEPQEVITRSGRIVKTP